MTKSVSVVGTGMLGSAVAQRLVQAGHNVYVYNRTPQKAKNLVSCGCTLTASPREAARLSDLVLTLVRDGPAVYDVCFGKEGIVHGCDNNTIIADMSTILPADSTRIRHRFEEYGICWLGTPVMGGPDAAVDGQLVAIVDGDEASLDSIRDVLGTVCSTIHHVGGPGTAHAVKLCMNMQIASLAVSLSEGITLARAMKIPPDTFLKVLNSTYFGTGMSKRKAYKMIKSEYNATFTLENLTKDLGMIRDAAGLSGVHLEMSDTILDMYTSAVSKGLGGLDYTGILEFVRMKAKPHDD
ncbi:MAG: NAD(P)-dependent oxidoreductase [Cenarchaeum sp. SB0666_bin_15]|nr:NAD(P)-dependent oxidoreductase [Cenarchaeum sp. SB0666_bin_15]MYB46763.1 NAD(P)-dependent oxidoreductase [Cenarchaeum sp. SB0662_bin_33]